jgi:hypothetical protein
MDEPTFSITQDTLQTLSRYLSDKELARLGTVTTQTASPLAKLHKTNAYWKSRVAKIFPLSDEDYIPNWKEFYLAFTTKSNNTLDIQSQAVGRYLPLNLIQRWISMGNPKEGVITGLVAVDRDADFQAIKGSVHANDLSDILSSSGGWQMLCSRISTLREALQESWRVRNLVIFSMRSSDPAHFLLVAALLDAKSLKQQVRSNIDVAIEYAPQNISIYLPYLDDEILVEICSDRSEWQMVTTQARQQLYEIVVSYYPEDKLKTLLERFPSKLLPMHLCILRGIRNNKQSYSRNLLWDVKRAFMAHVGRIGLEEFLLFNSVFPDTISNWLAAAILLHPQRDLAVYLVYSKNFPPELSERVNKVIVKKLGEHPHQQPEGMFTDDETLEIRLFLTYYR